MSFGSKSLPPPTAEQRRRWELIRADGCVACHVWGAGFMLAEIHHLKSGNVRMGHDYTVGLCPWHHRGVRAFPQHEMEQAHGPSLANGVKTFWNEYGSDEWLLNAQNILIGWTKEPQRERKRKSRCTAAANQVKRPAGGFAR